MQGPGSAPLFGGVLAAAVAAVAAGRRGGLAGTPEILGSAAAQRPVEAFGGQATLEQFPDRGSPAGHALGETPIVQSFQFFASEHYLKPLTTGQIVHWSLVLSLFFQCLNRNKAK